MLVATTTPKEIFAYKSFAVCATTTYDRAMTDFINNPERNSDLDEWLDYGKKQGWIVPKIVCQTHDMIPMTERESSEYDDGGEPCIHVIRIFEDEADQREALKGWE